MNKLDIKAVALALSLAFSAGAMAQALSKADYDVRKDNISAEYKSAKAVCASLSGSANDICIAEADGNEKTARAELEAGYKPTTKTQYQARLAKAEAGYAVAKEKCNELAGNAKDVCVKEAKARETIAKADAKVQLKTSNANLKANGKSADARSDASDQASDARREAAQDKLDAQYGVAKEKCDAYAGAAKDHCLNQAKVNFNKS